jgi:DNA-binding NarL/FixJ family response regulator
MVRTRILIADDQVLIAEALRSLLQEECDVVGIVGNGEELLSAAQKTRPEIVLLELGMPLFNGVDAGKELKELLPKTKIIVITRNEDGAVATMALRHWASGYLLKTSTGAELKRAIVEVLQGNSYVTPSIERKVSDALMRDPRQLQPKQLTKRQRQVLQLLAEGQSMKEAAAVLDVALRTIAYHKYKIMEERGLKSTTDLIRMALREHLIFEASQ